MLFSYAWIALEYSRGSLRQRLCTHLPVESCDLFQLSWWLSIWGTLCKVRLYLNLQLSNYFRHAPHVDTLLWGSFSVLTWKIVLSYTEVLLGLNKKCQIRVKLLVHCKNHISVLCVFLHSWIYPLSMSLNCFLLWPHLCYLKINSLPL